MSAIHVHKGSPAILRTRSEPRNALHYSRIQRRYAPRRRDRSADHNKAHAELSDLSWRLYPTRSFRVELSQFLKLKVFFSVKSSTPMASPSPPR